MRSDMDCPSGKLVFLHRATCKARARHIKATRGVKLRPYLCRDCGFWHLTSSVRNQHTKVMSAEWGKCL